MTDNTSNDANGSSRFPSHFAFQVRDREGKQSFWTRITEGGDDDEEFF